MLNRGGESGYLYLATDLRVKVFNISAVRTMIAVDLSSVGFVLLRYVTYMPNLQEWMLTFYLDSFIEIYIQYIYNIFLPWANAVNPYRSLIYSG